MEENNNLDFNSFLSSDLNSREKITIKLEGLLIAGNYDEAKLLLEPSQPVDIADVIGSLPLILQALAFRLLKKKWGYRGIWILRSNSPANIAR